VARLSIPVWIGNACAALFGKQGAVSQQAQVAGCSRQTVYDHTDKVQQAVADAQLHGPCRERLLANVRALHDENSQLWRWLEHSIDCPKTKRRQFAVTAAAMGLSLQQILILLAILLPTDQRPGRTTLGRWVQQAARQANRLLKVLDAACQRLVLCLCLDEIFLHRKPVLMAVEPHSMTWVLGQRVPDRSGPTWSKALAAWPMVRDVAVDGGSGLELGLELANRKRQEDAAKAPAVPLSTRLDVFHTLREGERALRLEWARAEETWQEAEKADRAKGRYNRTGCDRRHFSKAVTGKLWAKAAAALLSAEAVEAAWGQAAAALEVFRPDGRVNDRAWAAAQLQEAAKGLLGARWAKTRRMLLDERSLTFLDRLQEELAAAEPAAERREGLVMLWRWWRQRRQGAGQEESAGDLARGYCVSVVMRQLGEGWEKGYRRVSEVLRRVVRASSVVECLNSVVRMHQARHRNLSQELLDLKRLFWNCRAFVSGQRRKRCPYEHLGLKLPTYDPWALLQIGPEQLMQLLSS
jgi:hypothetical protein